MYKVLIFTFLTIIITSCDQESVLKDEGLTLDWEVKGIDPDNWRSEIHFSLINRTGKVLKGGDWSLHWNQMSGGVDNESLPAGLSVSNVNGDYFVMTSSEQNDIAAGDSLVMDYILKGISKRAAMGPVGAFIHLAAEDKNISVPTTIIWKTAEGIERLNAPTAATRFRDFDGVRLLDKSEIGWIIPTPKSTIWKSGQWTIPSSLSCQLPTTFANIKNAVSYLYSQSNLVPIEFSDAGTDIKVVQNSRLAHEAYLLKIGKSTITIEASEAIGAYYGFQSLGQMLFHATQEQLIALPTVDIDDAPRFAYRGMHFDIGRNYYGPAKIKQLMDFMALFKLNKFHFNITEDEGWRLEIPGLPELTEVGSKRGYTVDELDRLNPAYGSGPDENGPRGSGYFTRSEYIDLIKYAAERNIEVIPEINAPGHARAAIKSMRARYHKYMESGEEEKASEYLLHDPDDESVYRSAQGYNDNVICVCQESSFTFMFKVIDEIAAMYTEAGVPMKMFHSGGDELPYGAWQKSPVCQEFLASTNEVSSTSELHEYFLKRIIAHTKPMGMSIGGWEEIVLKHGPDGHNGTDISMTFINDNVVPYVWNASWGSGREDMVYRLANVGYNVVMSNSSSFYFDMTDDKDPENYGLDWSGITSYQDAWSTEPMNIFLKPRQVEDRDDDRKREQLNPRARSRFLGIQAQMWTETVRSEAILDELMMPNLPVFAERAWSLPSAWINESSTSELEYTLNQEWNKFSNTLGQRSIHLTGSLFGGTDYDLPKPGAIIENGKLVANTMFPGLTIRYTTDGSIPNENSPIYTEPIEVPTTNKVKLRTFDREGRGGRISETE